MQMSEIVTVYALKDIPHITGVDMKEYGRPDGFKAGQTMNLPRENAENLIRRGYASKHPPELKMVRAVFEFEDGSKKTLEGKELGRWRAILLHASDYFLPGGPDMILGVLDGFPARIWGFIPPDALETPIDSRGLKWIRYEDYIKDE